MRKKFCHRHPVNLAPHDRGNNKRIEMADVICREQKPAVVICVFAPHHANARDTRKQQFHQQPCGTVGKGVNIERIEPNDFALFNSCREVSPFVTLVNLLDPCLFSVIDSQDLPSSFDISATATVPRNPLGYEPFDRPNTVV